MLRNAGPAGRAGVVSGLGYRASGGLSALGGFVCIGLADPHDGVNLTALAVVGTGQTAGTLAGALIDR